MDEVMRLFAIFNKGRVIKPLTGAYFLVASIDIIAELNKDILIIMITKPLLMPLLIAIYWCSTKKANFLFIVSLLSVWMANLFFLSASINLILIGTLFFLIYRLIVMFIVFRTTKFPGYLPMLIGAMPFLFIYLFVANLTYKELGDRFFLFLFQGFLMIIFGGFCLGSYILKSNTSNTYLLISTMLFTATQFILVIKIFYISFNIFQPLAMLLFVFGQYLLYQYIMIEEKKHKRYRSMKSTAN